MLPFSRYFYFTNARSAATNLVRPAESWKHFARESLKISSINMDAGRTFPLNFERGISSRMPVDL